MEIEPWLFRDNPILWEKKIKENCMAVGITHRIIVKRVRNPIIFNIIDLEDPKKI